MRFGAISGSTNLDRLRGFAATAGFRRKVAAAERVISEWLSVTHRPVVSCGGGKDSTAVAILVRGLRPSVPIICADPCNPLPDRAAHVQALEVALGGPWMHVRYHWDYEAVLDGKLSYPGRLKVDRLVAAMQSHGFDGVAMGLRMDESRRRHMLGTTRGSLYQVNSGIYHCQPILRWSAEEVLALSLATGIPVNPVYTKHHLAPGLQHIRDGTWWPHYSAAVNGYLPWLRFHYPSVASLAEQVEVWYQHAGDRGGFR